RRPCSTPRRPGRRRDGRPSRSRGSGGPSNHQRTARTRLKTTQGRPSLASRRYDEGGRMPQVARTIELTSNAMSVQNVSRWLSEELRQPYQPPGLRALYLLNDAANECRFLIVSVFGN